MTELLWLDFETTGLDPHKGDCILECSWGIADFLDPFTLKSHETMTLEWPSDDVKMDETCWKMHSASGLIEECKTSGYNRFALEASVIGDCQRFYPSDEKERVILAGSSIRLDKEFIKVWCPRLHAFLHYRMYDVTAVKLYCQSLGMPLIPKKQAHRAKEDILESIAHARLCKEWMRDTFGHFIEVRP